MPIAFQTGGLQQVDRDTWRNPVTGDLIATAFFDLPPDLPASLDDVDALRRALAHQQAETGCLIEAHVITVDGQPALLRLEKSPAPGGLQFTAGLVIPKATASAVVKLRCLETGRSGTREAALVPRIGFANMFRPHPYAPELRGRLPFNAADDMRWDPMFPTHPLTRARAWILELSRTVKIDPWFAALPGFTGPEAAATPESAEQEAATQEMANVAADAEDDAAAESQPAPGLGDSTAVLPTLRSAAALQ
ncbi:hypothetical protein [Nocardia stercoris]|uniref:hypothetical protein n=1 Tax=Nocardia stercoris TaxID=2483361 RepID=UPI0018F52BC6|nr:hypothetical protein [Nocardia stercoris]